MTNHVGISEDQLANRSECTTTKRIFSRAAKRVQTRLQSAIADRLNGNAARRRAIKQRLTVAMMATERHPSSSQPAPPSLPGAHHDRHECRAYSTGGLSSTRNAI